ncbi:MAG: DUF349 domain-containing protein [Hydrogenophaga sp.]|nr:DUF349 domain-containing protein [Hydrogenophaga sp.]
MSLFSLRKPMPNSSATESADASSSGGKASGPGAAAHPMDDLTGGAFSAPTSGERAARIRVWLQSDPSAEVMAEVFKELSQRDRGAARALKERLDELKRQKTQEHIGVEWAQKAETLLGQSRMNPADAMAWQRDAARAGAALSREPLAGFRNALAERVKAIEDLQHRIQVEREAAVLIAQRIEVLSTKSWRDAYAAVDALRSDVIAWQSQASILGADAQWPSIDPKFPPMLDASKQQLQLVWDAFEAALTQAVAADVDAQAELPAVPVWAEELRMARGEAPRTKTAVEAPEDRERKEKARLELERALGVLEGELGQGHGKSTPKAAAEVRAALKHLGRSLEPEIEARAQTLLTQAGELEGWQRWRADQLREELVQKAEALAAAPEGQRLGGRKLQEALRTLREQWKTTDQGGPANHALWRRFDEACTLAHKQVESWLAQIKQQTEESKAQRMSLIAEVRAWTEAHAGQNDWKAQIRALHAFSERWRESGHLSEKVFAELQPQWKAAMHEAHASLEAAQGQSVERRRQMIDEAVALGEQPILRIDAVKALQQRWQTEAHEVPLDRKQEQKLWDAFRKPIDLAFQRKSSERERAAAAMSAHDQRVLKAAKVLEQASSSGDARQIREAQDMLSIAVRGVQEDAQASADMSKEASDIAAPETNDSSSDKAVAPTPARKLVAMRGDDRPGMKRAEPAGRDDRRPPGRRDHSDARPGREARRAPGPRLGDAAFRAQRQALEHADAALRKLTAQAHGEVLTQVMTAWEHRSPEQLPSVASLGAGMTAQVRASWGMALGAAPAKQVPGEVLLRIEMAAEVPSPAEHLNVRRQLQLQLLTRRHEAGPAETWRQDVAQVFSGPYDAESARRLQHALKVLMLRR